MISSVTKEMMNGNIDFFAVDGSILAALIQGLLRAVYQTAPNSHTATAATTTASQFTTEKSIKSPLKHVAQSLTVWDSDMRILQINLAMERLFASAVKRSARPWCA